MTTVHEQLLSQRSNGILMPLAAMKTGQDWGVGDFTSLQEWTRFLGGLGAKIIQILPLQETAPGQNCPYSALSAFAIDPVYIDVAAVREASLSPAVRQLLHDLQGDITAWRLSRRAPFKAVKEAKLKVLWQAYQFFLEQEMAHDTPPARAFAAYCAAQRRWLRPTACSAP